jgi:hypothetical protein
VDHASPLARSQVLPYHAAADEVHLEISHIFHLKSIPNLKKLIWRKLFIFLEIFKTIFLFQFFRPWEGQIWIDQILEKFECFQTV